MSTQSLTSAEIASKIAYARDALANFQDEEATLSLPAVSGDADAASRVADIRVQVRQIEGDISILVRAQEAATLSEIKDAEARDAVYRARHLANAKVRAGEIVASADRVEDLIVELQSVLGDIANTERAIWNALREAGAPPDNFAFGRKGLSQMAMDRMVSLVNGQQMFRVDQRTTADIARAAWAHLLEHEDDRDDII